MQQLTISNVWVEECFSPCGRTNTFYIPRPQTAFAILKSGSGEFRDGVRSGEMRCKDIFIVPFGATYTSSWHGDPYTDYISLHFNMPLFQNPLRKYYVQSIKAKHGLSEPFESILNAYRVNDCAAVLKAFYAIFEELLPDLACEELLIQNPQMTIDEISEASGFESSIYFRRVFKSITGMSPTNYRKNERGDL